MLWRDAVLAALHSYAQRYTTHVIARDRFIDEALAQIVQTTASQSALPGQTLSRTLQELRDEGLLYFSERGVYVLLDDVLPIEREDIPSAALDYALRANKLSFATVPDIPTGEVVALRRQRKGQRRLRILTLRNYRQQCALCDVQQTALLVAAHIARWRDHPAARGDLTNVICLCRWHDALFEYGYLALHDDYMLLKHPAPPSRTIAHLLATTDRFTPPLHYVPSPLYLAQHRARVGLLA
ncbi:MAG: HNH endonuclease [Armatimonadetes bacterium]|nr:HNH endonuclease [Anaerolineae bacterium]